MNGVHLIQSRELFGPPERQAELRQVWAKNDALFPFQTHPEGRPSFAELFLMCKPRMLNVITNADIYFEELPIHPFSPSEVFALSRWDVRPDGQAYLWDHGDSQDTYVIYGGPHYIRADFPQGVAGCDNRLLHVLRTAGYTVTNPSKTIKTYHLHNVAWRSYLVDPNGKARGQDKIERIPGPYAFCKPPEL